ncbi:uncharacterized protein LOC124819252 [Hydra vulgaris]|uniref:uncharacterized protein LOC124819252 n=1 Tax=Hydra vulgaris TaxID=6087 RepID=UPI001F5EC25C|nr:uncharacterized protein LOC124819252 [Hydra vulgaris]
MKVILGVLLLFVVTHGLDELLDDSVTNLEQGELLAVIPELAKSYTISFNLKPESYSYGFHSVLHFTVGNDLSNYGDRTPGLWFQQHDSNFTLLHIAVPINENPNRQIYIDALPLNVWTNVVISQQRVDSKYVLTIALNKTNVLFINNNKPRTFKNVKVFASDPWYPPHNGSIKNVILENGEPGESLGRAIPPNPYAAIYDEVTLKKNYLIGLLGKIERSFFIDFNLKLNSFSNGQRSVIHLTIGEDNVRYGDRIPGIWIYKKKLRIAFDTSNKKSKYFDSQPLSLHQWINIKTNQSVESGINYFNVYINHKKVYEVQYLNAQIFKNVLVYAGDPWYKPQDGSIKDFLLRSSNENFIYEKK